MKHPFYSLLMWLAQPLLRRKLARRAVAEPGYAEAVEERFGHYRCPADSGRVWIHAVSLGETRAAAILLAELRQQMPGLRLLLTHGTATGRAEGAKLLQDGDIQVWQPWDTPDAVQRFLAHFRPAVGVLMETEVWPNLTDACARQGIALALANARMNPRSHARARRLLWLARPVFGALAAVWAQTEGDAARLRDLGAKVTGVFGNLKFDASPQPVLLEKAQAWRTGIDRPVVLLASSREGEEKPFLKLISTHSSVKRSGVASDTGVIAGNPEAQYLIVPRHPQRFDEVAALIAEAGLRVSRRRDWGDGSPPPATGDSVWLGDSLGEMALYYGLADVALLGGSFEPLGGQNLIEAAACGCPVVMGPHTFNFAEAAALAQSGGAARETPDMTTALTAALGLLANPEELAAARQAAIAFSQAHRGAASRTARAVISLMEAGDPQLAAD
ncbi:MAG: 3-deoxy-D-manno-octulosonic acid transferase [Burkholderiaceae bacterium]|nr:3-deoxy-D-manno-octulosonic acid transferase [Burkholderiaceae bacterium]